MVIDLVMKYLVMISETDGYKPFLTTCFYHLVCSITIKCFGLKGETIGINGKWVLEPPLQPAHVDLQESSADFGAAACLETSPLHAEVQAGVVGESARHGWMFDERW